jgi:hypothetical protein
MAKDDSVEPVHDQSHSVRLSITGLAVVKDIRTMMDDPDFQQVLRNIRRLEEKMEGRAPVEEEDLPLLPVMGARGIRRAA